MVVAAMRHIKHWKTWISLIKVSLKAFDVPATIEAYRDVPKNPLPAAYRDYGIGAKRHHPQRLRHQPRSCI